MARSMEKAVAEYKTRFGQSNGTNGAIYCSDIQQIIDMTRNSGRDSVYDAITWALQAGYMMGYRKAKRDGRRQP